MIARGAFKLSAEPRLIGVGEGGRGFAKIGARGKQRAPPKQPEDRKEKCATQFLHRHQESTEHRRLRWTLCFPLLPVTLGGARPATGMELVPAIDLVPTVGSPRVPAARPHGVTSDPHMLIALPAPVSGRPRITMALHRNYFNPRRRRSDLDNDSSCERRSGRNSAHENQRHQYASRSPLQRAIRARSRPTCSPDHRGAIRCRYHEFNTLGSIVEVPPQR